jgi:hypothetical protein
VVSADLALPELEEASGAHAGVASEALALPELEEASGAHPGVASEALSLSQLEHVVLPEQKHNCWSASWSGLGSPGNVSDGLPSGGDEPEVHCILLIIQEANLHFAFEGKIMNSVIILWSFRG